MEILKRMELKDIITIDIETARLEPTLEKDTPTYDSYKYSYEKELKEDQTIEEHYIQWSGLYPEFARVLTISVGRFHEGKIKVKTFVNMSESQLLSDFNDYLYNFTDTMSRLLGHAIIGFDAPFIFKRMLINRVPPHRLLDISGKKPWDLDKTITDTKRLWQGTSYKPVSLINIATAFGLASPKDDIDGSEVGNVFWEDPEGSLPRIAKYCEKDVITTANVFLCMRGDEPMESESWLDVKEEENTLLDNISKGKPVSKDDITTLSHMLKSMETEGQINFAKDVLTSLALDPDTRLTEEDLTKVF